MDTRAAATDRSRVHQQRRARVDDTRRTRSLSGGPFAIGSRSIEQAGGDPVFGAVTKESEAVELQLEEGTPPIPAQLVPLPPSMPFDFDLFFASYEGDVAPTAVALDADGLTIGGGSSFELFGGSFDVLGYETDLTIEDRGGARCYRVTNEVGEIKGCLGDVTLASMPLPNEDGHALVFAHVPSIRLNGMELDVLGGQTLEAATCAGPICLIGIPPGSGSGTLWLLQKGARVDSTSIAWTPEGVQRI